MQIIAVTKDNGGTVIDSRCFNRKEIKKCGLSWILESLGCCILTQADAHTTTITITHR